MNRYTSARDDYGTVVFQFDKETNGRQIQVRYKFENEKDFEKEKPSKAESFRKVKDENGFRYEKTGEETYKPRAIYRRFDD